MSMELEFGVGREEEVGIEVGEDATLGEEAQQCDLKSLWLPFGM